MVMWADVCWYDTRVGEGTALSSVVFVSVVFCEYVLRSVVYMSTMTI